MSSVLPHFALAFCIPLCLTAPARCQLESGLSFRYRGTTTWPSSLGIPGTMTRCFSGDFNGDGVKDAIALVGGVPVLLLAPDTWQSVSIVDPSFVCADCDRIPTPPPAPPTPEPKNDLAAVCASGLVRLSYKADWSGFSQTVLSSDSLWSSATMLKAGFLNSNNISDYVGVSPAHDQVPTKIVVLMDGSGPNPVLTSFGLPGITVYEVGLVQYDGTGDTEIMTLDSYGVEVFATTGARVKRFARGTTTLADAVCTFRKNNDSREHIAWFRTKSGSTDQELAEMHWEPLIETPQLTLAAGTIAASSRVVRVAAFDPATDALTPYSSFDLVLSTLDSCQLKRLRHLDTEIGSATFALGSVELMNCLGAQPYPASIPGSAQMPPLLVDDFNADSLPDLLQAIRNGTDLYFLQWRGSTLPENSNELDAGMNFIRAAGLAETGMQSNQNVLTLALSLPDPPATGANCLEIVVWSCPAPASETEPATYQAENHYSYQTENQHYPSVDSYGLVYPEVRLHLTTDNGQDAENELCFPRLYWLEVRQSALQTDGTLRAKSATYVAFVGSNYEVMTPWFEGGYSQGACLEMWSPSTCASCENEGQNGSPTVIAPGTATRHRLLPTSNPPPPISPEPVLLN